MQVAYNLKILTGAMFAVLLLKQRLGLRKWLVTRATVGSQLDSVGRGRRNPGGLLNGALLHGDHGF